MEHFHRQSHKPKPNSDIGIVGAHFRKISCFVSKDEEEDLQLKTMQVFLPKFKTDVSMKPSNEIISESTAQSPENISDFEEDSKYGSENVKLKMENLKISFQLKESQPLSNKGNPFSPLFKNQAKMAKKHPYRNLIFNPSCPKEIIEDHLRKVHSSLLYAVHHLKKPKNMNLHSELISLGEPKSQNQKTLFLDLDETLIHSCSLKENPEYIVDGSLFKGDSAFGFNVRPHCTDFLKIISKYYEVFIFTASSELYANYIVDILDPHAEYVKGILHRNHCLKTKKGICIKDLRIIKNREMKNMVIVDNNAHAFALDLDNGIPILEWKNDRNDKELKYLLHYLLELAGSEDVRTFNRKVLKLQELANLESIDFKIS